MKNEKYKSKQNIHTTLQRNQLLNEYKHFMLRKKRILKILQ